MRSHLNAVRLELLRLHRALIAATRGEYERAHGRPVAPAELLELVVMHPSFAWLRPLSRLLAELDEQLEAPELDAALAGRVHAEVAGMLALPRYLEALQLEPEVVLAHAAVHRALRPLREARVPKAA